MLQVMIYFMLSLIKRVRNKKNKVLSAVLVEGDCIQNSFENSLSNSSKEALNLVALNQHTVLYGTYTLSCCWPAQCWSRLLFLAAEQVVELLFATTKGAKYSEQVKLMVMVLLYRPAARRVQAQGPARLPRAPKKKNQTSSQSQFRKVVVYHIWCFYLLL